MTLNPDILTWARDTAGLSPDEAARALGFKDTRERSAAERLKAGQTAASNQLARMGDKDAPKKS